jgi:hypothetical protein
MELRINHGRPDWLGAWLQLGLARSMRLTGAFITLCALVFVSGIAGCCPTA